MNQTALIGRLIGDPDIKGADKSMVARYTLAVDRRYKRDGDPDADFIRCVTFGKGAEFAQRFLKKGTKVGVTGRIQTGSYTDKDGRKVYTTDVIVEQHEFCESKKETTIEKTQAETPEDGFRNIPDDIQEDLPFA